MYIINKPIGLPDITICSEVTSSDLSKTPNTPFGGIMSLVKKNWTNFENEVSNQSMSDLFAKEPDFDADSARPFFVDEDIWDDASEIRKAFEEEGDASNRPHAYDPAHDTLNDLEYARCLEDIHPAFIEKYVMNLKFRFTKQGSATMAEAKQDAKTHKSLFNVEGDGNEDEANELMELQTDTYESVYPQEMIEQARADLPMVLKKLLRFSQVKKLHMYTFLRAFMLAKRNSSTGLFTAMDLYKYKIYKADADTGDIKESSAAESTCGELVSSSRTPSVQTMFQWLIDPHENFAMHQVCINFMSYMDILQIDIVNDDMSKYTSAYINSLHVPSVTPNKTYNKMVYDQLRTRGVQSKSAPTRNPVLTVDELLTNTIRTYKDVQVVYKYTSETLNGLTKLYETNYKQFTVELESFHKHYVKYCVATGNLAFAYQPFEIEYVQGIACLNRDKKLTPMFYKTALLLGTESRFDDRWILLENGLLLNLTKDGTLSMCSTIDVKTNYIDYFTDSDVVLKKITKRFSI